MTIVEAQVGRVRIAFLSGRLDSAGAPAAEARLLPMVSDGARLVADLEGLGFLSSAGLRVFLRAARLARGTGGALALAAPPPAVREVLEISGFDQIMPILPTREAAVALLEAGD